MIDARIATGLRYLVGGLLIGGFWFLNRHRPPVEEALRTISVFALVLLAIHTRLRRRDLEMHLVPLVAVTAALVVAAAVFQTSIRDSVRHAGLVTAAGLGLAIAVLGPILDPFFFDRRGDAGEPRPARPRVEADLR